MSRKDTILNISYDYRALIKSEEAGRQSTAAELAQLRATISEAANIISHLCACDLPGCEVRIDARAWLAANAPTPQADREQIS